MITAGPGPEARMGVEVADLGGLTALSGGLVADDVETAAVVEASVVRTLVMDDEEGDTRPNVAPTRTTVGGNELGGVVSPSRVGISMLRSRTGTVSTLKTELPMLEWDADGDGGGLG